MIRCTIGLEWIKTHLVGCMQIPSRFGPEWLDVAVVALRFTAKQSIAALCGLGVKIFARLWLRRRQRELIEVQGGKLLRNAILVGIDVGKVRKPVRGRNGKLLPIIQARIEEAAFAMHLQVGYECVPVRDGAPTGPGVQIHTRQAERWWDQGSGGSAIGTKSFAVEQNFRVKLSGAPGAQPVPKAGDVNAQ
jgi:hypothetical protein